MTIHASRARLLLLIIAIHLGASPLRAEEPVGADRARLTFRDAGLYCNVEFSHGPDPTEEGLANMLPAQRAADPRTAWSFYIMQCNVNTLGPESIAMLKAMARNGKKVILRAHVGRMHEAPDVDAMEQWLVTLFEHVDPAWLYAITLDEEQVYWHGWAGALTRLYHRVKARWPALPVYQWWTPMVAIDVHATSGWVALPSDGWVIDLYGRPAEAFEKKLVMFLEAGRPVVHIAWASPTWPQWSGAETWDGGGRAIMDDQVAVCRAYDVPVAYFCTQPAGTDERGERYAIRWGWHARDPLVRRFYRALEARVLNYGHLPAEAIGFRAVDAKKRAWARSAGAPAGVSYSVDEEGRKQATMHCRLGEVPPQPGTHPLPIGAARPEVLARCVLDGAAANLAGGLRLRGMKGAAVRVPIVFRVEPRQPIAVATITASVTVVRELGGSAALAWSADGTTWNGPVATDPEQKAQSLTITLPGSTLTTDALWVRVELVAGSGTVTNTCASLDDLSVTAAFEPALR